MHPWNFESRTRTIERYGAAAIPAGSTLADWPLGYDELEPAYAAVERAIGVAGSAGNSAAPTGAGSASRAALSPTRCRRCGAAAGRS